MKKIVSILLAVLLLTSAFSITAFAEGETDVLVISGDGVYVIDENVNSPVDIDGFTGTVILRDANIQNFPRSAILVKGNSNVTFVLDGQSDIAGYLNYVDGGPDDTCTIYSCGIEVEYHSSVTFEGEGVLNVTGGKFGVREQISYVNQKGDAVAEKVL